jgi:hypothetical protein
MRGAASKIYREVSVQEKVKLIAFHLPQFYPTPYNDEWWGKGFTEWTNVTKARPRFRGHYQPHLPADLGFYDLRLPEARQAQADLAREYGIHGFCYYHYWFNGRRLLERPVNEILASGEPDFPFCLCWANENWTRVWDGGEKHVLMQQSYNHDDDRAHIRWLLKALGDRRYIRVGGKPFLLIYRAGLLPDPRKTAEIWRSEAMSAGLGEIHLCSVENNFETDPAPPATFGFDSAIDFQPKVSLLRQPLIQRAVQRLLPEGPNNRIHAYRDLVNAAMARPEPPYLRFPCVCPSWDNASRRNKRCFTLKDASPDLFRVWLQDATAKAPVVDKTEKIVFINAWNEWSEGCHLEPCQRWGRGFLEAVKQVLNT